MTKADLIHERTQLFTLLASLETRPYVHLHAFRDMAENLKCAANTSDVLLTLIVNHLDWMNHRDGTQHTQEGDDNFNWGIGMLADHTRENLTAATDAIYNTAYPKPAGEVAA